MSGMPGFDERLSERERWATVAFLRRVLLLSPADFGRLARAVETGMDDPDVPWVTNGGLGFEQLQSHANAARGRALFTNFGCPACHAIPGIGQGAAGPPLPNFAERQYIAGLLVNVPANLVTWIQNPKRFKENTAMPNLNVSRQDALDIAAFLYTRGSPKRLNVLKQVAAGFGASQK